MFTTDVRLILTTECSGGLTSICNICFIYAMPEQHLLLLLVGLPPHPSSLRVRVWRRLRSMGAVPLKRSAYLLPDTAERYEDYQWLAQEIERDGGEATLIRVQQIENVSAGEVLRLFHEPRDHDY